ncbi:MAG TPA: cupin domain-containing protein [Candidatus Acidoferrales bacterium]|nr:cupin domain-containing protein [Candidatus Acidoferrales bacterium]
MMNRREMGKALAITVGAMIAGTARAEWPVLEAQDAAGAQASEPIRVDRLMSEPLAAMQDPEVRMLTLTIAPGATSQAHRHTGPVFAYILEGTIENQVDPEPVKTYKAGDYFYEPPMHVHRQLKNLSATQAAKILIAEVGEKGKEFTIGA